MVRALIAGELQSLAKLDRSNIYLFVFGPGCGESLAIALPVSGWILVDSCRAGGTQPQSEVLRRWRGEEQADPVAMHILTHPHGDHAAGFADVLGQVGPLAIGIPGTGPPQNDLLRWADAATTGPHRTPTDVSQLARTVRAAIIAISSWAQRTGGTIQALHDGAVIDAKSSPVTITCRAPHSRGATAILAGKQIGPCANHLSVVLEIAYGATRILATGDMPRYEPNGKTVVDTGWDSIVAAHRTIGKPSILKIPHHGSREAIHPDLFSHDPNSVAVVAPNSSSALPRFNAGDAAEQILALTGHIFLTTVPTRTSSQPRWIPPAIVQLTQLRSIYANLPTGNSVIDRSIDVTPPPIDDALDAAWCFAFDDRATLAGLWRGRRAFQVV